MTFEEWWDKNSIGIGINVVLQTNHEYIKPFFEDAWKQAVEGNKAFKELKDLIDPEVSKR